MGCAPAGQSTVTRTSELTNIYTAQTTPTTLNTIDSAKELRVKKWFRSETTKNEKATGRSSMNDESQKEKLRQHFARRVTTQARVVLDTWQKIHENREASAAHRSEFSAAADKLVRYAQRFDMAGHAQAGERILALLNDWEPGAPLGESLERQIQDAIEALSQSTLRRTDMNSAEAPHQFRRTPVYIALANQEIAGRLIRQLEFFGFRASAFSSAEDLTEACALHKPETILVDVNFGGEVNAGISTIERLQERHDTPIPIIFMSDEDGSIETRLRASRCGGEEFFYPAVDPGQLIEKIETYTHGNTVEPYRVLVLDDSRAQAKYMETVLKKAGMTAHIITDPMQIIHALEEFSPEIIILDINHLYNMTNADHDLLIEKMRKAFGSKVAKKVLTPQSTLGDFWNAKAQVVVIYDDSQVARKNEDVWMPGTIDSPWQPEVQHRDDLMRRLDSKLMARRKDDDGLFVSQGILNPNASMILKGLVPFTHDPGSLKQVARKITPAVTEWVKRNKAANVNIVIVDWFHYSKDYVDVIRKINIDKSMSY